MSPDPKIVREIAQEIILRQAKYWNAAEIRQDYRADPRCTRLSDEDFVDLRDAVINAVADATVTVLWPAEQPQDACGDTFRSDDGSRFVCAQGAGHALHRGDGYSWLKDHSSGWADGDLAKPLRGPQNAVTRRGPKRRRQR